MNRRQVGIIVTIILAVLWKKYINEGCVCKSSKSLEGKTVIITGGNAGIGKSTALECAKLKAHLIIASRNVEKSLAARDEIVKETGHDDIHVMKLDLGDLDSVTEFANEILAKEKYIDYLVNNAGIVWVPGLTKQGFDKVFGINHLGHFLLTNLLLGRMKEQSASRPVRIVNLSSAAYQAAPEVDFETAHLEQEKPTGIWDMMVGYGKSKLANIYFTSELANRLKDFDITSYSLHPGAVVSEIGVVPRQLDPDDWWFQFRSHALNWMAQPFLRNGFYGTQTTMSAMLDDFGSEYDGAYLEQCQPEELKDFATVDEVGQKLWEHSVSLMKSWLPDDI